MGEVDWYKYYRKCLMNASYAALTNESDYDYTIDNEYIKILNNSIKKILSKNGSGEGVWEK